MNNLIDKTIGNILETDTMKIDKNIIKVRDRTFQISNISSVSIYSKEKIKYPEWAIILLVIGVFLFAVNAIVGFILLVVSGIVLVQIFLENIKEVKRLSIWMNNGETYTLNSENIDFLYKVADAIEHCMNENNGYCYIDFKANDISDCNFAIGNYNSVN